MTQRPYRIQADYNPDKGAVESIDIFDCSSSLDPVTDAELVNGYIKSIITEDMEPELFAAINAVMNQTATDARLSGKRQEYLTKKAAEEAANAAKVDANE